MKIKHLEFYKKKKTHPSSHAKCNDWYVLHAATLQDITLDGRHIYTLHLHVVPKLPMENGLLATFISINKEAYENKPLLHHSSAF